MDLTKLTSRPDEGALETVTDVHWSHHLAAISMIAGAILLVTGRKRQALAIAAAGAASTLLEQPQAAQQLWVSLPTHIRTGQDFLVRAETFLEKLTEQAAKLREMVGRQVS